jgi:hypothetical protein
MESIKPITLNNCRCFHMRATEAEIHEAQLLSRVRTSVTANATPRTERPPITDASHAISRNSPLKLFQLLIVCSYACATKVSCLRSGCRRGSCSSRGVDDPVEPWPAYVGRIVISQ